MLPLVVSPEPAAPGEGTGKGVVPGTRVSVEFEARYNASVQGVVEKVLAVPENDGAEESEYGVIICLDSAEGLKFGLHGTATLATESAGAED